MDLEKLIYLIFGAMIGFFLSLAKDWLMESKKQKEKKVDLRREQLEKLYIDFSKWVNYVISEEKNLLSAMKNSFTFNDYLDLKIEKEVKFDAQRNEMILNVYAESLLPRHKEVMNQLFYLNHIEDSYQKEYNIRGSHSTEENFIKGNELFTEKFISASENFKTELISEIQKTR